MESLFPVDVNFPAVFIYVPEFLSTDEEENLILEISKIQLHTFIFQGFEAKERWRALVMITVLRKGQYQKERIFQTNFNG